MGKVLEFTDDSGWLIECPACGNGHKFDKGRWTFNGDLEKPTFSPSMLVRQGIWTPPVTAENLDEFKARPWPQTEVQHVCHSFVRDGKIQFLDDCTHALKGQTVDLPDCG